MDGFKLLSQLDLKRDPEQLFTVMNKLGQGSYGEVYKAMHKQSGTIVALKIITVQDDSEFNDIMKEINVMNACDSPSIVRFYGSFYNQEGFLWVFHNLLLHLY